MVAWIDTAGSVTLQLDLRSAELAQVERTSCCPPTTATGTRNRSATRTTTPDEGPLHGSNSRSIRHRPRDRGFRREHPGEFDCITMFCCEDLVASTTRCGVCARTATRSSTTPRSRRSGAAAARRSGSPTGRTRRSSWRLISAPLPGFRRAPAPMAGVRCGHLAFPCRGCL